MKKWNLVCSKDGTAIDFETTITADREPGFWECYQIAFAHGCSYFFVEVA